MQLHCEGLLAQASVPFLSRSVNRDCCKNVFAIAKNIKRRSGMLAAQDEVWLWLSSLLRQTKINHTCLRSINYRV